ncbi:MAG: pilus assembly protein PilP [Magnetococcus sp. DMHC-6]
MFNSAYVPRLNFMLAGLFLIYGLVPVAQTTEMPKPASELVAESVFIYNPLGRRNPFESPFKGIAKGDESKVIKRVSQRVKEPLEAFQLDSLKLVAIIFQVEESQPVVMIEDPSGKGHMLGVGNHLGSNEGEIVRIEDGSIQILEPTPTSIDQNATRLTILSLQKEGGE